MAREIETKDPTSEITFLGAALNAGYLGSQTLALTSLSEGRLIPWGMSFNGPRLRDDRVIFTVAGKAGGSEVWEADLDHALLP